MRTMLNGSDGRRLNLGRLLGAVALLFATIAHVASGNTYVSNTSGKRWTNGVNYDTTETYVDVNNFSETYRMQWELYEGSIALTQMAVVWKEISTQQNLQIVRKKNNAGTKTNEVLRIRRIWQLESKGASLGIYDDENELGSQQLYNDFANMEYINPAPKNGNEWFVGDVVPFERCAYIVNINVDNSVHDTKYYTFSRLQTAVRWDPILKLKKVVTQEDFTSQTFTEALSNQNVQDMPLYHVEMGYWPFKGSFFWFNRGSLYLKHDSNADMTDACEDPNNRCDFSAVKDPCSRDTPLFNTGSTMQSKGYTVSTSTAQANHATVYEIVFDSIFVIFADDERKIFRIGGQTYDQLASDVFYAHNDASNSAYGINFNDTMTVSTAQNIHTMCSMDFHGLFLGIKDATSVIRLEFNVGQTVAATPQKALDASNRVQILTKNYHEMATTSAFKLTQTKGYFGRHRPCYMVNSDEKTQLKRLSTQIKVFFPDPVIPNPIDLYTESWSEGAVPARHPQLLRFHLFSTMPGDVNDSVTLENLDYNTIKAFVYDMRARKEWGKFALTSAGNGMVDTASGEECEPLQKPPINLVYDPNGSGSITADKYPDADSTASKTPNGYVSWIPANTILDESGNTARVQYMAEGYYTCTSAAFLVPYDGCGDGVPSNGPPEDNAFNKLHAANQRNGTLGFEVCDDGGNADDGCATDCKSIKEGYECLKWGEVCTPKCGNGHVEGFLTPQVDANGAIVTDGSGNTVYVFEHELDSSGNIREECDMGSLNSPNSYASATYADVYTHPCSSDCKLIEKKFASDPLKSSFKKWDCQMDLTPISSPVAVNATRVVYKQTCTYLCGNQQLDGNEECDLGGWAFSAMSSGDNGATGAYANLIQADVQDWVDNQSDPKTNGALILGCSTDCTAVVLINNAGTGTHFKFPTDRYSVGTDRCGDGIMDGPISYYNATTGNTITIRNGVYPTPVPPDALGSARITGYTQYWDNEYSGRMLTEQCDNGGDTAHGCTRLCEIEPGWECFHYYHHILGVEEPYFTSICQEIALPTLSRRLSPNDFDKHGRFLTHLPRKAYHYKLPLNAHEMRPSKHTLNFDPKVGLNGQVRIVESKTCVDCFGFTMAYQRDTYTDPDYWYYGISAQSGGVASVTEAKNDLTTGVLKGKQRNTFGPYMVVNKNMQQIEIWGYSTPATDTTFTLMHTTTLEASIEYLGSHEFYWFPYKELLMAKLSDGSSFRFYRLASNFAAVSTAGDAAYQTKDKIDSGEFRLFHVPGRTMVPPIFYGKMAYFYISGVTTASTPKLVVYQWNDLSNEFEKKCQKDMTVETSQSLYHKYTMVNTGADGVIFNQYGQNSFTLYQCSDSTGSWVLNETPVTFDNAAGALTGPQEDLATTTFDQTAMTLLQAREDPENYVSGTVPDIYGIVENGYIQKFTWSSPQLTFTAPSIVVPIDKQITVTPEWMDIGRQYLVLLSPSHCAADENKSTIDNASVQFYNFANAAWTCRELTTYQSSMDIMGATYWDITGR